MSEVEKITTYIYDDGNNVSLEATVFERERIIARRTFSQPMTNARSEAHQWLREQDIADGGFGGFHYHLVCVVPHVPSGRFHPSQMREDEQPEHGEGDVEDALDGLDRFWLPRRLRRCTKEISRDRQRVRADGGVPVDNLLCSSSLKFPR
jgi:hypothetical protein